MHIQSSVCILLKNLKQINCTKYWLAYLLRDTFLITLLRGMICPLSYSVHVKSFFWLRCSISVSSSRTIPLFFVAIRRLNIVFWHLTCLCVCVCVCVYCRSTCFLYSHVHRRVPACGSLYFNTMFCLKLTFCVCVCY